MRRRRQRRAPRSSHQGSLRNEFPNGHSRAGGNPAASLCRRSRLRGNDTSGKLYFCGLWACDPPAEHYAIWPTHVMLRVPVDMGQAARVRPAGRVVEQQCRACVRPCAQQELERSTQSERQLRFSGGGRGRPCSSVPSLAWARAQAAGRSSITGSVPAMLAHPNQRSAIRGEGEEQRRARLVCTHLR